MSVLHLKRMLRSISTTGSVQYSRVQMNRTIILLGVEQMKHMVNCHVVPPSRNHKSRSDMENYRQKRRVALLSTLSVLHNCPYQTCLLMSTVCSCQHGLLMLPAATIMK